MDVMKKFVMSKEKPFICQDIKKAMMENDKLKASLVKLETEREEALKKAKKAE